MKVLLVNGSPHADGCTFTALNEVAKGLKEHGIECEFFQLGKNPVRGCVACGACAKLHKCVFDDDPANKLSEAASSADGIIVGSPVYYAGPNGALLAVLDRAFYSRGSAFRGKPAAAIVSCRRGGASAAFDRLNKYFSINSMPIITSDYWNSVHGNTPEEVKKDEEGLQVMRILGRNMAKYLLEKGERISTVSEARKRTNFIR